MSGDRWLKMILEGGDLGSLASEMGEHRRELEVERRAPFIALGAPEDSRGPAAVVFHRQSRLDPGFWPEMTPEEKRQFDRTIGDKRHAGAPIVTLPRDPDRSMSPLRDAIARRRTATGFSGQSLGRDVLGEILVQSAGMSDENRRTYPSAGAAYPIEIYVLALRISDLDEGLYHYVTREHALEHLGPIDKLERAMPPLAFATQPAAILLMTLRFPRAFAKYMERGYRFALIEAGHIGQNILLVASALGLGSVCLGGFFDDAMNAVLGVDPAEEAAIYGVMIGAPA